jgi:hypothetical protein
MASGWAGVAMGVILSSDALACDVASPEQASMATANELAKSFERIFFSLCLYRSAHAEKNRLYLSDFSPIKW